MADGAVSAGESGEPGEPDIEAVRAMLAPFLERNPFSTIGRIGDEPEDAVGILTPWGDSSVAIVVPTDPARLADALNNLILPERFTAIWHADTRRLEVIWTALLLSDNQKEIFGRKFQFQFKGKKHDCSFDKSSKRLVEIAKHVRPRGMSPTNHRNLQSFSLYTNASRFNRGKFALDVPKSFWISNVTWSENKVIDLINNLNFYLTYYDDASPTVLIHQPTFSQNSTRTRYIHGDFPDVIAGNGLNDNLLGFWSASQGGNTVMRFILYYRIIEYAAHHYIDEEIRSSLTKLLSTPHLGSRIPSAIDQITDMLSTKKLDEVPKLKALFKSAVDPRLIWREAQANKAFFSKPTKFEGGFTVKALLHDDDKEAAFCQHGLDSFSDLLRKIRNALSHGRDQETGGVITPTTRNFQLLRPWVHLIGTAAGEVVVFKDAT